MAKKFLIDDDLVGKRADVVVAELLPALSRAYVQKLFGSGRVRLDKKKTKPGHKLRLSEHLEIDFDEKELEVIAKIDLPIIYEDENVLVINKPVGVISHSRGRFWNEPSVASFVRDKTNQAGERAGIVHRLDRVTSGVMICANNQQSLSWLQKQFAQRQVKKTYLAVVSGHLKNTEAIIDMPIERNPKNPQTFRVGANGKPSKTHYKVQKILGRHDVLVLSPETGRTHQLRVHLKQLGHPIVGDTLYGGEGSDRLYLHAQSLEVTLPGGQRRKFEAPLPKQFKILEAIG